MHRRKQTDRLQCHRFAPRVGPRDHKHAALNVKVQAHRHYWRREEWVARLC